MGRRKAKVSDPVLVALSATRADRVRKNLPALLVGALNKPVTVTIDDHQA
jgi:hypothetical protein